MPFAGFPRRLPQLHRVLLVTLLLASPALAGPAGPAETTGASPQASNTLNPAISLNALVLGSYLREGGESAATESAGHSGPATGLSLQEAELQLSSTVDPYFRAVAVVAFADEGADGFEVDLEELYVSALALPRGLGLRLGKLFLPFGRHNLLHTHAYPFIQAPLVVERLFGAEGLNEPGVELSWLPGLAWYSELLFVVGDGRNEELFEGARADDLMFQGHWKNVWDTSESATLELGGSALYGKRHEGLGSARAFGLNATYKYRPLRRAIYHALELQAELIRRELGSLESADERATGGYLHARWQASRRFWLQGRYDHLAYAASPGSERAREQRVSLLGAFVPSEFSALRLEYATLRTRSGDRDHQVLAQLSFTIGSHPAHAY